MGHSSTRAESLQAKGFSCMCFVGFSGTWVLQPVSTALTALCEAAAALSVLQPFHRGGGISHDGWYVVTRLRPLRSGGSLATVGKKNAAFWGDVVAEKSPWSLFLLFLPFCTGFARCKTQLSAVYREEECQFSCGRKYQGSDCEGKGEIEECHMASTFLYFILAELPLLSDSLCVCWYLLNGEQF